MNLRACTACGYVGCCDDSKNRHARAHAQDAGHPIVRSLTQGEDWLWCYQDETYVEAPIGRDSQRVIRSYLLIATLYTLSASVIWGVNTLFLLDAGLDIFGVFVANAVFTGSMALFEIPTGVLADTRGRRASFLLSVALVLVGTLGYVGASEVGGGLLLFCLMSVVLGLGYTFYSGATEAWLVDALNATGFRGKLDRVFAKSQSVSGAAMLVGTVGGGLIASVDLVVPYYVRSGLLLGVFIVAFATMHDIGFSPQAKRLRDLPSEMGRIAGASVMFGWRQPAMRLLVLASLVQGLFLFWGFYAWQPHFLALLGRDAAWVAGVIAALISVSTIGGNSIVQWFTRYCGKRTTLLLGAAIVFTVGATAVGLTGHFWVAVPLYLVAMGATGVWMPVKQAFVHQITPSEHRATVVSFDSLVSSGGSVVGQAGLGRLAQISSIGTGYIVGGLITVLAWPIVALLRRRNESADLIVGSAGKSGACAAQGLPSVAAVNSTAQ